MAYIIKSADCYRRSPYETADTSDGIAPSGFDIMSTCFIVDKLDVAICDGKDKWYAHDSSGGVVSIAAGQSWAELFSN